MFVSNGVVFFSSGVMFSSNLAFCLFKRIASNERGGGGGGGGDFCIKQVYGFLFFSLKRTKFNLSFDWDLAIHLKIEI